MNTFFGPLGFSRRLVVLILGLTLSQVACAEVRILVYGDSNTFGVRPIPPDGTFEAYADSIRWPGVMQAELGPSYIVKVDGMPGRTLGVDLKSDDGSSSAQRLNGLRQLPKAISLAQPLDLLIVMLGTNDLIDELHRTPQQIALNLARVSRLVPLDPGAGCRGTQVLVVVPPHLADTSHSVFKQTFSAQAITKSGELGPAYERVAETNHLRLFDASKTFVVDGVDGIHMSSDEHARLGAAIADQVKSMLATCTGKSVDKGDSVR